MLGDLFNNPLSFFSWVIALLIAITVHEFSHAWMADRLGDPTPKLQGRLTLNPLAHLDPIGTIMLILIRFGWGKPVVFDPFNLRHPRRDAGLISIAGPVSNLITATASAIFLRVLFAVRLPILAAPSTNLGLVVLMGLLQPIIILNVMLAVFNLVPIHPLDGFKVVGGILPENYARQWYELEPYGLIFLLFLIFPIFTQSAPLISFISPIITFILNILLPSAPLI